jgi:hypothetical protein
VLYALKTCLKIITISYRVGAGRMIRKKVTQEEWDQFMKENKIVTAHTVRICDPPVKFYWTQTYPDMSFGQHSVASRVMNYAHISDEGDELYLHDYSEECK